MIEIAIRKMGLGALAAVALVGAMNLNASANDEKWSIAQSFGYMSTDGLAGSNSGVGFGLEIQHKVIEGVKMGVAWQSTDHELITSATDGSHLATNTLMATADFISGTYHQLYAGPRLGWMILNLDGVKFSRVTFGAQAGVDFKLADGFSMGPDAAVVIVNNVPISTTLVALTLTTKFHF